MSESGHATNDSPGPGHGSAGHDFDELEKRLRDAAYTAVGLGLFAYKYSEPRVRSAFNEAGNWHRDNADRLLGDLGAEVAPLKQWFERFAAAGRSAQADRSRQ